MSQVDQLERISITIPRDMVLFVDGLAAGLRVSRSAAIRYVLGLYMAARARGVDERALFLMPVVPETEKEGESNGG